MFLAQKKVFFLAQDIIEKDVIDDDGCENNTESEDYTKSQDITDPDLSGSEEINIEDTTQDNTSCFSNGSSFVRNGSSFVRNGSSFF